MKKMDFPNKPKMNHNITIRSNSGKKILQALDEAAVGALLGSRG